MNKVIFSNQGIAIHEDLACVSAPQIYWEDVKPANAEKRQRAKIARDLGLQVEIPEPEFSPPSRLPAATQEEIEASLKTLRYVEARDKGPQITGWESLHPPDCYCDECPSLPIHSPNEREIGPGWDIDCPEEWFEAPRRVHVKVSLPDGSKIFSMHLRGRESAGSLSASEASQAGVPEWIQELARKKQEAYNEAWEARRKEEAERLKAQLAQEFGLK